MSQRRSSKKSQAKKPVRLLVEDLETRLVPSAVTIAKTTYMRPDDEPYNGGSTSPQGYTPAQIRTAYQFNQIMFGTVVGDGAGQTIALIDAYDEPAFVNSTSPSFATSDLAEFDAQFGIPNPPSFMKVNQLGQSTGLPGTDPSGAGNDNWEGEEALDVEWAHALAPAASIILVECNSAASSDLYTGAKTAGGLPGVSVVSMSFGSDEFAGETAYDSDFLTPAGHQGVTFLASAGDTGSAQAGGSGGFPAESPNVVAVGGTSLFLNPDNSYNYEVAWGNGASSSSEGGSGGGTSQYEPEPVWQQGVQNTGFRTMPDVSFIADPYTGVAVYDSYNDTDGSGPWAVVGGTSLSSPSWAALIAVSDQGRVLKGGSTLNGATQTLPDLYGLPTSDFHDITSGNNGAYSAVPGYDEVTGIGTPIANLIASGLAGNNLETITPSTIPDAAINIPYRQVITGSELAGTGATTMQVQITSGAFPAGLSYTVVGNTVVIAGTPTAIGTVSFTVTASNATDGVDTQSYTLTCSGQVVITTKTLPPGTVNQYYNQAILSGGGNGINTWSYRTLTGALPAGLSFVVTNNGLSYSIVGTPLSPTPATTPFTFAVTVVDSVGSRFTSDLSLTIYPAFSLSELTLPAGLVHDNYTQVISAEGGSGVYTMSYYITSGYVPLGMAIVANSQFVEIYGTPTAAAVVNLRVVGADSIGDLTSQAYTLTISPGFTFGPSALPFSTVGAVYDQTITATGGTGATSVSYQITSGTLDPGLSITTAGNQLTISGTSTVAGQVNLRLIALDSRGDEISSAYTLVTYPTFSLNTTAVPGATVGHTYDQAIGVANTPYPYQVSYTLAPHNTIPAGLVFYVTSSGQQLALTGDPQVAGTVTFTATATDTANPLISTSNTYTIVVAPAVKFTQLSIPADTIGFSYNQTIAAFPSTGTGITSVNYSITGGAIPNGIYFTNTTTGVTITGRPTVAGSVSFNVTATDSVGETVTQSYTFVSNPPVSFSQLGVAQGTVGMPYNVVVTALGGSGTVEVYLTILSGSMPRGMAFQYYPSGLRIVGTAVVPGNVQFRLTAIDANGSTAVANYNLIFNPAIVINRTTLPAGPVGVAYSQAIVALYGTGGKTASYTILSGAIPTGLTFTALPNELVITGRPTANQVVTFRITFVDQAGASTSEILTLVT